MKIDRPDAQHDRLLTALIEAVLNGKADDAQFAELERQLQGDAAARDVYVNYLNLHCELCVRFAVEGDIVRLEAELENELREGELADFRRVVAAEPMKPRPRRLMLKRVLALSAIAALALLAVFAWDYANRSTADPVATIRDLEGEVTIINSANATAARIGDALRPGDRLRTGSNNAHAILLYADETSVQVHFNSVVQVPADGDVRLRLLAGSIEVDAAPQPANRPLILATDHARYVVLGTRFRLYRNEAATRLELDEGKVRLERQADSDAVETIEIEAGNVAIASAKASPVEIEPMAVGNARLRTTLAATGQDVALSPAGDLLVIDDSGRGLKTCHVDDFSVQDEYARDIGKSYGLAFGPDGHTVVRLTYDNVLLWRPGDEEARKLPFVGQNVRSRALSADGLFVAQSDDRGIELSSIDFTAGGLTRFAELPNRNGPQGKAWCLALSRGGARLAAGFWDGTMRVYDVEEGRIGNPSHKTVFERKLQHTPTHAALTDDGRHLAAFTQKDGLQLINLASGEQRALWSVAGASACSLKFTPDGRWLMAGCSDRTVRVWSVAAGRPLLVVDAQHAPWGMAWIAEQRLLITADGNVKAWDCEIP